MGGCATKPRELEGEAPAPIEEPAAASEEKAEVRECDGDQGLPDGRKSLGHLFKESEEKAATSETDEKTVEGKEEEPKEEETSVKELEKEEPKNELETSTKEATATEEKTEKSTSEAAEAKTSAEKKDD